MKIRQPPCDLMCWKVIHGWRLESCLLLLELLRDLRTVPSHVFTIFYDPIFPLITSQENSRMDRRSRNLSPSDSKKVLCRPVKSFQNGPVNKTLSTFPSLFLLGLHTNQLLIINSCNLNKSSGTRLCPSSTVE